MEYTAVLNNYLEYSLGDNHAVSLSFSLLTETYTPFFFCIFICAIIFVKQEPIEKFRLNRFL